MLAGPFGRHYLGEGFVKEAFVDKRIRYGITERSEMKMILGIYKNDGKQRLIFFYIVKIFFN